MRFFLCVIGLVLVIEGLPYFAFPDRLKGYLARVAEVPSSTLRTIGFVCMMAGIVLVYIGRS